jgi:DNA invertase Pin-like site-specific DNA recombinase
MRLVGYLRVSSDGQVDGFGLTLQREQIAAWAKRHGHDIVQWCEDAITGTADAVDREGLSCAFGALADGDADGLVVARLDRLARALTTQEALLAAIWRDGASIYTADSGEVQRDDPDDPMRTAMRQMAGVFAQLDRALIVKRLADGRRAKTAAGGHGSGRYPYGDSKAGPVPSEQATLAVIHDLRRTGQTWRAVADHLNTQGIEPQTASSWSEAGVRKVARP